MIVAAKGAQLAFPRTCMCCGGAPETTRQLLASFSTGSRRYRSRVQVPYCNQCLEHVKLASWSGLDFLFTWLTSGLYLIAYFVFVKKRRMEHVRTKLLKPSCGDAQSVGYWYQPHEGTISHIFEVKNEAVGRAFAQVNQIQLNSRS